MKGWLDNFGKADNANESSVNVPDGFVGLSYDTSGRNYSPAWGGQFQNGGYIPLAQNGITTSDPSYRKLYDAGKIARYDRENNIYNMPTLPEVTVSAPNESLRYQMGQHSNRFLADALGVMNAPQELMMEAITGQPGKIPSDYIGFENPGGWFDSWSSFGQNLGNAAIDTALDPTTYIGLGAADKLTRNSLSNALRTGVREVDQFGRRVSTNVVDPTIGHYKSIKNTINDTKQGFKKFDEFLERSSQILDGPIDVPNSEKVVKLKGMGASLNDIYADIVGNGIAPLDVYNSYQRQFKNISDNYRDLLTSGVMRPTQAIDEQVKLQKALLAAQNYNSYNHKMFIDDLSRDPNISKQAIDFIRENPNVGAHFYDLKRSKKISDHAFQKNLNDLGVDGYIKQKLYEGEFRQRNKRPKNTDFIPGEEENLSHLSLGFNRVESRDPRFVYDGKFYSTPTPSSLGPRSNAFVSYEPYKKLGDKALEWYANRKLKNNSVLFPEIPTQGVVGQNLIHSLFAHSSDPKAILMKALKYVNDKADGFFSPSNSLSSDSYDVAASLISKSAKTNPDSKIRYMGYQKTNDLGFMENLSKDKELVASYINSKIRDIEKVRGERLPKAHLRKDGELMLPYYGLSKGSTNDVIDTALANQPSIVERSGLIREVYPVSFETVERYKAAKNNPAAGKRVSKEPRHVNTLPPDDDYLPFQNGGIIKDNQGYWNPENWGKPVQIDSNQITMRGVNQPLLGISDYGDVQYMEPGMDYQFAGNNVTEFPMKKLDDLRNFTNNNKSASSGWLDKYQ